jgi:hypothetical protein
MQGRLWRRALNHFGKKSTLLGQGEALKLFGSPEAMSAAQTIAVAESGEWLVGFTRGAGRRRSE